MQVFIAMPLGRKEVKGLREAIRAAGIAAGVHCLFPDEDGRNGEITHQICDAIRRANGVVAEISSWSPNVIWEYGYASSVGKPVIPITQDARKIFFDTSNTRAIIYRPDDLKTTLQQDLIGRFNDLKARHAHYPFVDLVGTSAYPDASGVMGLTGVNSSKLGLFELLAHATDRVVAAAQNHWFLVKRQAELRAAVSEFLSGGEERRFDLVMCDIACGHAVQTWVGVNDEKYRSDLEEATHCFAEFQRWADARPKLVGRVKVRRIPFVPASANFVDPDGQDGLLVMTPNVFAPQNKARPRFVISRRNSPEIFQSYWGPFSFIVD